MADLQLIIKNGTIVDGTKSAPYKADLLVDNGIIKEIKRGGGLSWEKARQIDAGGQIVAPGFIDIHSHSDLSLLEDGRALSKLYQGVTTEVTGNCSMAVAPFSPDNKSELKRSFSYLSAAVDWSWSNFQQYLDRLGEARLKVNVCPLIGYGAIRARVKGFERGKLTVDQLQTAKQLVDSYMTRGLWGISTGLVYIPCCYASPDELIEICRVVAEHDGLYATHIRNEGYRLLEALEETFEIVKKSGVRTEISHLKASGQPNWGLVKEAVARIYRQRQQGLELAYDLYPYLVGSTYLSSLLPRWVRERGRAEMGRMLARPSVRRRLREALLGGDPDWPGYPGPGVLTPRGIRIGAVKTSANRCLVGKTLQAIAASRDQSPWDCFFDLIIEEQGEIIGLYEYMSEADVEYLYRMEIAAVGSDGLSIAPEGHWLETAPHPRYYGTFPRFIDRYVKQKKLLLLEEAIRRITALPARQLGLKDRGTIVPGKRADLVIFSLAELADRASYENPHQLSVGVNTVLVNGQPVLENSSLTRQFSGQLLLKS